MPPLGRVVQPSHKQMDPVRPDGETKGRRRGRGRERLHNRLRRFGRAQLQSVEFAFRLRRKVKKKSIKTMKGFRFFFLTKRTFFRIGGRAKKNHELKNFAK